MSAVINTDISKRLDIISLKGDTFLLTLEILNDSEQPFDVSAYEGKMTLINKSTQRELLSAYSSGYTGQSNSYITMGNGTISIEIPYTVTADWEPVEYEYDLQVVEPVTGSVDRVFTWLLGVVKVNHKGVA
jgi:hypothetical protein